jgi:hypothetical protein
MPQGLSHASRRVSKDSMPEWGYFGIYLRQIREFELERSLLGTKADEETKSLRCVKESSSFSLRIFSKSFSIVMFFSPIFVFFTRA